MKQILDAEKAKAFTAWANTPPNCGVSGSKWELNIIELAEAGEPRFIQILGRHVRSGVIRSGRAHAALGAVDAA